MKKKIVILLCTLILASLIIITMAVVISFTTVKPTTEAINKKLVKKFAKIIYLPERIPSPNISFEETAYYWEMETPQNEVTAIRFKYNTAFSKNDDKIIAVLELPENGDPSIFNKVLPAVISDKQSLQSALDPAKANLSANVNANYSSIKLALKSETSQTVKISWEFEKENLELELQSEYAKIAKLHPSLLKILYGLPALTISLLGG